MRLIIAMGIGVVVGLLTLQSPELKNWAYWIAGATAFVSYIALGK